MELKRQLGLATAVLIIIADVIGTGIFVTTGQVLEMTGSALAVTVLFAVGGLIAITGSLCYAELATMWPDNGGEYVYLKKLFGSLPSFLTGWISMFIAFSWAAAMSSITAVNYINQLAPEKIIPGEWLPKIVAAGIIFLFGVIHILGVQKGSAIQNALTVLKLAIVFVFIALGFYCADWSGASRLVMTYDIPKEKSVLNYGAALIVIMYAYSGWNGTTYIAGEIKNPEKNLPRALFRATILIAVIYIAMNAIFILSSPGERIIAEGKYTIGALASKSLFGENFSFIFNLCIVIVLLSSVSVQMMIGPRVSFAMARDKAIFHSLERVNPRFGTPDLAIVVQMFIAIFYVFIGFDAILSLIIYTGFALGFFPLMSVIGMMILRHKKPDIPRPFKVPFHPVVPLVYIVLTVLMMATSLITNTKTSLTAIGVLAAGIVIFFIWRGSIRGDSSK